MRQGEQRWKPRLRPAFWLLPVLVAGFFIGRGFEALRPAAGVELTSRSEFLLDTLVTLRLPAGPESEQLLEEALAEVRRLDQLASAYRPESEVARINQAAGRRPVAVSPEILAIVQRGLEYSLYTGGRFDLTIGPVVRAWDIGGSHPHVPAPGELRRAVALVSFRDVEVNARRGTIFLRRPGMALDLGAAAKGFIAERVRELLAQRGVRHALIDLGGNIATLGPRPDGRPWHIAIRHPRRSEEYLGYLDLAGEAVATAGDYERFFEEGGRRYHHIFNPETGYPASGVWSATAVSPSAFEADLLSTAIFLLGPERGLALAHRLGAQAVVMDEQGRVWASRALQGRLVVTAVPPAEVRWR
ncbi:MAG: FAD:protein FMN transferase [Bacillota bacterium]|nr:FAD:protein FMN transferase [Bacillota bacterium]